MAWTTWQVLRHRNARLYLGGVVVSGFGTSAMWLVSGVWVKSLTGSSSLAALATFALWLPVLAGPLLGTLADRTRRRPLLIWTNVGLAVLLCALLAVDSADRVWILFAVLFVYGAAGVVHDAAEAALIASAVDKKLLGDFNGLRMTANEGMKLLAPLAGAGLFAAYGGARVALLDALTFLAAAGLYALLRVREQPKAAPERGSWRTHTVEGARYLRRHPALRTLALAGGFTMFLAGVNGALIFAVVDEGLGRSPAFVGVLYAVQGLGSVAVGLLSGPLLRRCGERVFAGAGLALFAVAVALRALPYDAVALAASAGIGVGLPCVLIAVLTAVQRETPDHLVGRVAATANTLVFAPNAVALGLGAGLVAVVDHRVLLVVLGVAGLAAVPRLATSGLVTSTRRKRGVET
ncbi:MFS transporter [Streptomyces sp. YC504]|uniref:MFS transporter n=1 Tax=Streptomyces mesophilus TaxID=1775132 RepID=A0A6G4XRF3_9ACTN|nr:MFS transporter [Streptomyces mesophilus]NGO79370.1 MFS transporter [Streptomyces mesophilus]